jgi:Insertion element 4 transposase N-terminal
VEQSVITRTVTVAPGRFAPGHLGELTQQLPFEMVDAALVATGRVQSRLRDLPARVVVYLLVAGCLFAELGYVQVWQRLTAGLDGLPVPTPTASASPTPAAASARRPCGRCSPWYVARLPPRPPVGSASVGCWCAPSTAPPQRRRHPANHGVYTTQPGHHGGSGYPCCAWSPWSPAAPAA